MAAQNGNGNGTGNGNGEKRLQLAIQKSGRLSEKSLKILEQAGLSFDTTQSELFSPCRNFPLDLVFLRDDDIPEYVHDGVCDLGIVGENVLREKSLSVEAKGQKVNIEMALKLGFGKCRLSLAVPKGFEYTGVKDLEGKRIATSYPLILKDYLKQNGVSADIVEISGSVEITPTLNIADAICDIVSTGSTLKANGLREVQQVLSSQSVFVHSLKSLDDERLLLVKKLQSRMEGVLKAAQSKYIMMNAPKTAIEKIKNILPGMDGPTIMELANNKSMVALHAVSQENIFWETMEELKKAGASSIIVVPIEKMIE